MADEKISLLPAAGALAGTEPVPIVQGGATKQTTTQDIADLAGGSGVPSVNGITGAVTIIDGEGSTVATVDDTIAVDVTNAAVLANLATEESAKLTSTVIDGNNVTSTTVVTDEADLSDLESTFSYVFTGTDPLTVTDLPSLDIGRFVLFTNAGDANVTLPEDDFARGTDTITDVVLAPGDGIFCAKIFNLPKVQILYATVGTVTSTPGASSGSFTTVDLKTVTVVNGIITSIV